MSPLSIFSLIIGILVGIIGWFLYPLLIQREPNRQVKWPGRLGKPGSRYRHFSHKSAVEYSVSVTGELTAVSGKLAEMIASPPDTPTKLTITNQTLNQVSFENPRLVIWPGHKGSYRSRELGFSQGHFHLNEENGKILVTYELDFSKLWQRARMMAFLTLVFWGILQIAVPIILWYILRQYPEHQIFSLFSLYILAF